MGLAGASVAFGMGGTGKSIMAAALMRDRAVGERFERLCWLTVGQTPDIRRLLALLSGQLLQGDAATGAKAKTDGELGDLLTLQQGAARAARGHTVLCVLDDVWDPAHARALVGMLDHVVLLVTTRVHHLLPGAQHVHCGLLSKDESLQLLLRAGDVRLPPDKEMPKAAIQVTDSNRQ